MEQLVNQKMLSIILRTAGPCCFMSMQMSSLMTALAIAKKRTVGELSVIPFLSLFTNGTIWFIYGSAKADYTICIPNFTAIIIGAICVTLYNANSTEKSSRSYFLASFAVICISIIVGSEGDMFLLGLIGSFLSVLLMGSPLSTAFTVIKEKKTDSMPFMTSVTAFLNGLCWTLYGYLVAFDPMLWVPPAIGLILSTTQLLLFVLYGLPTALEAEEDKLVSIIPSDPPGLSKDRKWFLISSGKEEDQSILKNSRLSNASYTSDSSSFNTFESNTPYTSDSICDQI